MIEPTGYTALDLVGFTDRGTYAANVNYVKNDLVHYGSNIWRILIDDTIGITPAEGPNYTLFIGEPTNLVERIIAPLEDNPATVAYQTGRQIIYNDYLYEVIDDIAVGDILIAYEDDPTNANIKLSSPVETQVLALNTRLTASEGRITDLASALDRVENRKIIFIGDSYQYGGGISGTGNRWAQGWLGLLTGYLGMTVNVDFFHNETPGYGFTTASSFLTLLQDIGASITDKNAITDIIVTGGLNDTSGKSGLFAAITSFMTYVKSNYPNAKVHIGYVGNYFCNPQLRFDGRDVAEKYRQYGQRNGASYISNSEYMLHDANYYAIDETWHPNEYGHRSIAEHMVNYIIDGSFDVEENYIGLTFTLDSGLTYAAGAIGLTKDISNGITHIKNQHLFRVNANGLNVTANAKILLGVVSANGSNPALGGYSVVGIPCTIGDYDGHVFQYRNWNTSISYEYDSTSNERRLYLNVGNTQPMDVYNIWIPPFDLIYSTNLS